MSSYISANSYVAIIVQGLYTNSIPTGIEIQKKNGSGTYVKIAGLEGSNIWKIPCSIIDYAVTSDVYRIYGKSAGTCHFDIHFIVMARPDQ